MILESQRYAFLPVLHRQTRYVDGFCEVDLCFFDRLGTFNRDSSVVLVNGDEHPYRYSSNGANVDIGIRIRSDQQELEWAAVHVQARRAPLPPDAWRFAWYIPLTPTQFHLPPADQRVRVIGDDNESSFAIAGFDQAFKLKRAIREHCIDSDSLRLLDWGCGCGRLSWHFADDDSFNLYGVDIDSASVAWCQANISRGQFAVVPRTPPTAFGEDSFDVIVGLSVITHLSQSHLDSWMEELHRILSPGGIIVLTYSGLTYFHFAGVPHDFVAHVVAKGYVDNGHDPTLDAVLSEPESYRSAFVTLPYLAKRYEGLFDYVQEYQGLAIQDVAVFRKRPRA